MADTEWVDYCTCTCVPKKNIVTLLFNLILSRRSVSNCAIYHLARSQESYWLDFGIFSLKSYVIANKIYMKRNMYITESDFQHYYQVNINGKTSINNSK